MDSRKTGDFSQGSILSNILHVAAPMTVALLINVLYSVVDRMYIGHIAGDGRLALTGIGLAAPILMVISGFQALCSTGGAPLFSIARGEGDEKRAGKILGNACFLLVVLGILLTVVGLAVKETVLWNTGADESTFRFANDYLSVYLFGTVFTLVGLGLNPFLTAQGFATKGMLTVLLGAVTNIILDPIFIFAFHMGVRGAALATILSQMVSAVWVIRFLTSGKARISLSWSGLVPDWKILGKMVTLGSSGFIAQITTSAVSMLYNSLLATWGNTLWIGAMTIINSLREISFMPVSGVGSGAQPVLGYNYGAKKYDRVRSGIRILTVSALICTFVFWVLYMTVPGVFVRIFNNDAELLPVASIAVRLYFCMFPFMCLQMAGQSTFTSLGYSREAVFFSLLRKAILVIPLALILPHLWNLGVYGIFLSEPLSDIIGGGACYLTMRLTVYRKLENGD